MNTNKRSYDPHPGNWLNVQYKHPGSLGACFMATQKNMPSSKLFPLYAEIECGLIVDFLIVLCHHRTSSS